MSAHPVAKTAAGAAAAFAVLGMLAPTASAQSYSYPQNYGSSAYSQPYDYNQRGYQDYDRNSYDYCRDDRGQRQGAGTVIGGAAGAIAGSQLAARGRRTEGSILGGVVGAVIGNAVGRSSGQNCEVRNDDRYYDDRAYAQPQYDDRYDSRYQDGYGSQGYDDRYSDSRYVRVYPSPSYSSDYSSSYSSGYGYGDSCRLAESRIRLPDGRMETRYVRSCPDQSGRYRVVD